MSSRFAPHRTRAHYLSALKDLPIPVRLADPPDPARITVLGTATIADRTVRFGTVASAPRLWMALETAEEPLLGYVTGLAAGEPDLWVCEGAHREWVVEAAHARELKRAAARVWTACVEHGGECEG